MANEEDKEDERVTMQYSWEQDGVGTRISFMGPLDATTAAEARPVVDALVEKRPQMVTVDISRVDFLDSSGVAVLVSLFKRVGADRGEVVVVGAQEQPQAVLRLLGIERLLCA